MKSDVNSHCVWALVRLDSAVAALEAQKWARQLVVLAGQLERNIDADTLGQAAADAEPTRSQRRQVELSRTHSFFL